MFGLFRRREPSLDDDVAPTRPASVGDDTRVYAIGDIHGRFDLMRDLIDQLVADCAARGPVRDLRFILLGDLVDRGPDSARVVDLAIRLASDMPAFHCLMGNHEEVFGMALRGEAGALRFLLRIGGRETLQSYGIEDALIDRGDDEALHARMLECVPEAHRDYIYGLPDSLTVGDYLFVHAGIRPGRSIAEQKSSDLHWIREPFLRSDANHGHVIVHGHTITDHVDEQSNRIGIDTGAYRSGRLTALGLQGTERWFLQT